MEKIQGVKNFGNEGEGRFREILSCPPKMRVAPQIPPKFRDLAPPLRKRVSFIRNVRFPVLKWSRCNYTQSAQSVTQELVIGEQSYSFEVFFNFDTS